MKKYEHLFFDLDRTLWDFDGNSIETISDLFTKYELQKELKVPFQQFLETYTEINGDLWAKYRFGEISKDELRLQRFHRSLKTYGFDDSTFALNFNDEYVGMCSSKTNLMPYSREILEYLFPRYKLHVITNGFVEAQFVKIKSSDLSKYFIELIVSDEFGYRKPDKRIFHHAMKRAGATSSNSLMIGDDYVADVVGARAVGIDQVYLTDYKQSEEEATYVISSLKELIEIL